MIEPTPTPDAIIDAWQRWARAEVDRQVVPCRCQPMKENWAVAGPILICVACSGVDPAIWSKYGEAHLRQRTFRHLAETDRFELIRMGISPTDLTLDA